MSWKLPWAAGAICATANDLIKWQTALDAGRIVRADFLKTMRTPTTLADGTAIDYGLGTRLGMLQGHRVYGHTGSGGGFKTVLESFPDDHLIVAVLMNTENASATTVGTGIARAALGVADSPLKDLPVPKEELAALIGIYESDEGTVDTFERNGKLRFRSHGASGEGTPLLRQSQNIYATDDAHEVHFQVRAGRGTWGVLYSAGLMLDANRRAP